MGRGDVINIRGIDISLEPSSDRYLAIYFESINRILADRAIYQTADIIRHPSYHGRKKTENTIEMPEYCRFMNGNCECNDVLKDTGRLLCKKCMINKCELF